LVLLGGNEKFNPGNGAGGETVGAFKSCVGKDGGRRSVGDETAGGQEEHPVGKPESEVDVVGRHQDEDALLPLKTEEDVHDLGVAARIEMGGGFIQQEGLGALDEGSRQEHPAALAAGEPGEGLASKFDEVEYTKGPREALLGIPGKAPAPGFGSGE
jgi:hypothetical protein